MNDTIVIGALFGTCIGLLIGYVFKHYQDTKVIREIQKINDDLIKDLKDTFARREELYKLEINRLHEVIAQSARSRVVEHPEAAKMTDFVEISLERGGYKEIDLSGRAKR